MLPSTSTKLENRTDHLSGWSPARHRCPPSLIVRKTETAATLQTQPQDGDLVIYLDKTLLDNLQPHLQAFSIRNRRQLNLPRQEYRTSLKQPGRCQSECPSLSNLPFIIHKMKLESWPSLWVELLAWPPALPPAFYCLEYGTSYSDLGLRKYLQLSRQENRKFLILIQSVVTSSQDETRICWNIWISAG